MIPGIIGKKLGMSQVFRDNGKVEAVTVVEAGPCCVTQVRTDAKEGYGSIQLGFGKEKKLNSPERGHVKGLDQFNHLREFRVEDTGEFQVGDKVDAGLFEAGDLIDVTATSRSKGFAGVVKRHHFKGGPKTHGQSDRHRAPGSIGATTTPGRVFKGTRMAGRMGGDTVTVRNLEVYRSDSERNLLLVKGALPGPRNGLLLIKKSGRIKGYNSGTESGEGA
ncbi:MAG TPA: 50S ribosomal protein L3 [Dehalococcoidia bacterium]|nr:50S ribosomal protein L3 [Dehalococcoidia bacterium]